MLEYFGEEQRGNSRSIDGFLGRAENYPLSKPMVNQDQKGVKTSRKWEVGDQITRDLLEWTGTGGQYGKKRGLRRMYVFFFCFFLVPCLLSCGAMPLARHLHAGVYECGQCYFLHYRSHQYGSSPRGQRVCRMALVCGGIDVVRWT